MNRLQKLAIAKIAYRQIKDVIDQWESGYDNPIKIDWEGCITIDHEFFDDFELEDHEEAE